MRFLIPALFTADREEIAALGFSAETLTASGAAVGCGGFNVAFVQVPAVCEFLAVHDSSARCRASFRISASALSSNEIAA